MFNSKANNNFTLSNKVICCNVNDTVSKNDVNCVICSKKIPYGKKLTLECEHYFCEKCIYKWYLKKQGNLTVYTKKISNGKQHPFRKNIIIYYDNVEMFTCPLCVSCNIFESENGAYLSDLKDIMPLRVIAVIHLSSREYELSDPVIYINNESDVLALIHSKYFNYYKNKFITDKKSGSIIFESFKSGFDKGDFDFQCKIIKNKKNKFDMIFVSDSTTNQNTYCLPNLCIEDINNYYNDL